MSMSGTVQVRRISESESKSESERLINEHIRRHRYRTCNAEPDSESVIQLQWNQSLLYKDDRLVAL